MLLNSKLKLSIPYTTRIDSRTINISIVQVHSHDYAYSIIGIAVGYLEEMQAAIKDRCLGIPTLLAMHCKGIRYLCENRYRKNRGR